MKYTEYRGCADLVIAEVTVDDNESGTGHGYVTGTVKSLAGLAELSKSTSTNSETKYYDNQPAIVITSEGGDTLRAQCSALDIATEAELRGNKYDSTKGAMIEGGAKGQKYYAVGYKTGDTDDPNKYYVWRYKCTIQIGDIVTPTGDDGTTSNGVEITITSINTTHKFEANADAKGNAQGAKSLVVDTALDLADVSTFFDTVITPDTLTAKSA